MEEREGRRAIRGRGEARSKNTRQQKMEDRPWRPGTAVKRMAAHLERAGNTGHGESRRQV